jgi:hypothetical protein
VLDPLVILGRHPYFASLPAKTLRAVGRRAVVGSSNLVAPRLRIVPRSAAVRTPSARICAGDHVASGFVRQWAQRLYIPEASPAL